MHKIDEISEAARNCSTHTGYVGIEKTLPRLIVCLLFFQLLTFFQGPVSKNLQLERTAGKNALS